MWLLLSLSEQNKKYIQQKEIKTIEDIGCLRVKQML